MTVFYDEEKFLDMPLDFELIENEKLTKVLLDPESKEAPCGVDLAPSWIRDNLDVWARCFQWFSENNLSDRYKIVTQYPEMYRERSMDNQLILYIKQINKGE